MNSFFSRATLSSRSTKSIQTTGSSHAIGICGGAVSPDMRISSGSASFSNSSYSSLGSADSALIGNEKLTMMSLNERLASYLQKVHILEKVNADLELKIRQFLDSKSSPKARNYTAYFATISELQDKIYAAIHLKRGELLNLDNSRQAAEDFRTKYEHETMKHQTVQSGIVRLKWMLEDFKLSQQDLKLQLEDLKEELAFLKRNHEEEMSLARKQMSGQVHMEVHAPPQEDLTEILEEIREHYEGVTAKNKRELENWFKAKTETQQEVVTHKETLQTSESEIKTLKSRLQAHEIELQSELSMKTSLESSLNETKARYAMCLSAYQSQVMSLEEQLVQIRADMERQSQEYEMLLDITTRLEIEISEYRRLLDTEATSMTTRSSSTATKVITVMEEVVDGMTETLKNEMVPKSESLQTSESEIQTLKSQVDTPENELQSQMSMAKTLKNEVVIQSETLKMSESVIQTQKSHLQTQEIKLQSQNASLENSFNGTKTSQSESQPQTETLKNEEVTKSEIMQPPKSEIQTLKSRVQNLETELQSQMSLKAAMESSLKETIRSLSASQSHVSSLEEQVVQLRANMAHQSQEYQMVLAIKARLELEVAEYRRLLEKDTIATKTTSNSTSGTK